MPEANWQLNQNHGGFRIKLGPRQYTGRKLRYDYIVIGAGIVGLSTARELKRRCPDSRILLLEKESEPARHQSGRNSGVVHAGVYYKPGSLKARLCRQGAQATFDFCRSRGLPYQQTGKLLVATNGIELERMQSLFVRCQENGLDPELLNSDQLHELEPAITGVGAILVKESGIVDYPLVSHAILREFRELSGIARFRIEVSGISETDTGIQVHSRNDRFNGHRLVVCGGLMADRLAKIQGLDIDFRIIPYRGEYYRLRPELDGLVDHLIYPIPDPELPFLGVHLTRALNGSITVGPNAVQAWKREGYGALNFSPRDTAEMLAFPGFWKVSSNHFRQGVKESWNSVWKRGYLKQVQKYCPEIQLSDLKQHPAGVRAQAVLKNGAMVDDFLIKRTKRSLHVCNAPSPAATSAMPIASHLCDMVMETEA
jgi:L-2-hydroxyglutarate oxidase